MFCISSAPFFLTILFIWNVSANGNAEGALSDGDQYFEYVLKSVMPVAIRTNHLDPFSLPPINYTTFVKFDGLYLSVESSLYSGNLSGLFKGHRLGNCQNFDQYQNVTLKCEIVFGAIEASYQAQIDYNGFVSYAQVKVTLFNPLMSVEVTSKKSPGPAYLLRSKLTLRGSVKIELDGVELVKKEFDDEVTRQLMKIVYADVKTVFEGPYAVALGDAFRRTSLPSTLKK